MKNYLSDAECREFVLPYAEKFAVEMKAESASAIAKFYGDYTPIVYKRKFGLFGMWEQKITPDGRGYLVETKYSSAFFGASHRSDSAVFEGSFVQGWHGGPQAWGGISRYNTHKTSPSPWELIETFFNAYGL